MTIANCTTGSSLICDDIRTVKLEMGNDKNLHEWFHFLSLHHFYKDTGKTVKVRI